MTAEPQTTESLETSPIARAVNQFLLDCEARNLTLGTLRFYRQRLRLFAAFVAARGITDPKDITPTLLREYIASYSDRSPYYQHQHARVLKTFFRFLVRDGLLAVSPMAAVRLPRLPKDLLDPFSPDDVRALLDACEYKRDRAIVLTLLDSGVRANELLALDVGDFNAQTGTLRVRLGKGRKTRLTFVGPQTREAITDYLAERGDLALTEPLFATLTHGQKRMTFFGLQSLLGRLGRAAGVKPVGAHRFRRTFAIESLRAGMPLPQLAAIMGHEGLATLQRYLRLVADDLREAHEAHGAVDRLLGKKER